MRESRRTMREQMQRRMEKEGQHYQRRGSLFLSTLQGVKFFRCKEGPNLLDILLYEAGKYDPIEANAMAYVLRIFRHPGCAQDGGDIICIEQTFRDQNRRDALFGKGAYCPVCKEYKMRVSKGATKEETDSIRYANWPRTIYNIFDRRDPGVGCQVWETSAYLLQQYLDVISQKSLLPGEARGIETYIPYMDIEDGRSISFQREGMDEKSKFIGVKFEERRTPIPENVVDAVHPLDELIAWPSVESAHEAFWGVPLGGGTQRLGAEPVDRPAKYEKAKKAKEEDVPEPPEPEEPEEEELSDEEREAAELEARLKALKEKKAGKDKVDAKPEPKKETKKKGSGSESKCPYGHKFGEDIDDKAECEKCEVWKDCAKENDRLSRG